MRSMFIKLSSTFESEMRVASLYATKLPLADTLPALSSPPPPPLAFLPPPAFLAHLDVLPTRKPVASKASSRKKSEGHQRGGRR